MKISNLQDCFFIKLMICLVSKIGEVYMNQNNENLNQNQEQQIVQNLYSTPVQNIEQNTPPTQNGNNNKIIFVIIGIVLVVLVAIVSIFFIINNKSSEEKNENKQEVINNKKYLTDYKMSSNSLEEFDLYFLKEENEKVNKIYSPLSIKYALKMLEEGASGNTKTQLSTVLGDYEAKKYNNNANMSFANALFIRQSFDKSINEQYKQLLLSKYNAEVCPSGERSSTFSSRPTWRTSAPPASGKMWT